MLLHHTAMVVATETSICGGHFAACLVLRHSFLSEYGAWSMYGRLQHTLL